MPDTEQQDLVDRFGRQEDPVRILLCSDVASEGLNLHYFCHRLVHFDLPWSLMVFQQRNGRVDRYGQKHKPQIVYLFTQAVKNALPNMRFYPAEVGGKKVKQLVQQPFTFSLSKGE